MKTNEEAYRAVDRTMNLNTYFAVYVAVGEVVFWGVDEAVDEAVVYAVGDVVSWAVGLTVNRNVKRGIKT